jgi:hypothetical protein
MIVGDISAAARPHNVAKTATSSAHSRASLKRSASASSVIPDVGVGDPFRNCSVEASMSQ